MRLAFLGCVLAVATALAGPPAAPTYQVSQRLKLGGDGSWDYLVAEPGTNRLFVTRGDRVEVVDERGGAILATLSNTEGVHGVALAPDLERGFTSNGRANTVTAFDLKTLARIRDVPLPAKTPDAILYEPTTRRVFTLNARSHDATAIDARTLQVVGAVPLPGKPEFAVTDGKGHVYVNIEDTGQLVEIDPAALKAVARWNLDGCELPTGLAMDVAHRRLFSVCANRRMVIVDAASGKVVGQVPIGQGPDGAAFDAKRQLAFSSNGHDGTLTVVRARGPSQFEVAQTLTTQKSARTVSLDPATGRLFLSAAELKESPGQRPSLVPGSFSILVVAPR